MPQRQLDIVARHIRQLAGALAAKEVSDADLLQRFTSSADDGAFAALVERHGGLVWSVCRRVLRRTEDAEDAFQATFLILIRKAASVRKRGALASWLYGVAYRTALRAKQSAARRRQSPLRTLTTETEQPGALAALRELQELLDEELQRLPEKYRTPFVLCCLQGKSRAEAGQELGWKEGTVAGRLAQAREILRKRLARRGVALSAVLCASALVAEAPAAAPAALVAAVIGASLRCTAGSAASGSPAVMALARGVLRTMFATKLALAATLILAVGVLTTSMGVFAYGVLKVEEPDAEEQRRADSSAQAKPGPDAALTRTDLYGDPLPEGAIARLGTVRFRHGLNISCVSFAPNGKFLATGSYDSSVRVWDRDTGKQRARFQVPHRAQICCNAFSPDGKVVAAGDNCSRIWLWDWQSGREPISFKAHDEVVQTLAFSPDGKVLASGGWDHTVCLWEAASGRELHRLGGHENEVYRLAFSPNGKMLASAGLDKVVHLWNPSTGQNLRSIEAPGEVVLALAFSPDSQLLALGCRDHGVRLWDLAQGKEVRRFAVQCRYVRDVAFTPDGQALAVAQGDYAERSEEFQGNILLFDMSSGKVQRQLGSQGHPYESLAFSPDGKTLAGVGGHDSTLHLWDVITGREMTPVGGHQHQIASVTISADGRTTATAALDDTVRVWDTSTGQEQRRFGGLRGWLSSDGKTLLTVVKMAGLTLHCWDVPTGKERWHRGLPKGDHAYAIDVTTDRRTLALQDKDHVIRLLDIGTGKERGRLAGPHGWDSLTFSSDGTKLASASVREKEICIWDVTTGKELRRFDGKDSPVAFSPDARLLAVSDSRGGLKIFDAIGGKELLELLRVPNDNVAMLHHVRFSPDGRMLAVGCEDGQIRLWETSTGKPRRVLKGHQGLVGVPAFSGDGRFVVTGSSDTTALIWDLRGGSSLPTPSQELLLSLWVDLVSEDAAKAYAAIGKLSATPDQSVPFLRRLLRPTPRADEPRLVGLVRDLDDDDFRTRQRAMEELDRQRESAVPALRKALAASPSLELRRRAEGFLAKWDPVVMQGEPLRTLRAVETLEQAGTSEARQVLRALGEGDQGARLTREAKASLRRLQAKTGP